MIRFLGLTIDGNHVTFGRAKDAAPTVEKSAGNWLTESRGWWPVIREPFTGAWQRNIRVDNQLALSFHAVFACLTLIATDIAKLPIRLVEKDANGIWTPTESPAFSPVLRAPNHFQDPIQFWQCWILSKLTRGNTYVLKERDGRGVVVRLHILNPDRCRPLIAADGSVWYELDTDNLAGIAAPTVIVPAREIIHDIMYPGLFHPLCGVSPLYAAGLAATQGLEIQKQSTRFFGNNAQPSGFFTSDTRITEADAKLMKEQWEQNYGGENFGRVAVLGGGLKFVQLSMTAVDAQLIDQLKWSAQQVCGAFHVPAYKIGVGPEPLNNNVQARNVEYYAQCLHILIEAAEKCMDRGLGIGEGVTVDGRVLGVEFDIDNLLRMDGLAQAEFITKLVGGSIYSPDEGRSYFGKKPTLGGSSPMAQHQYYSLADLARRSEMPNPFDPTEPGEQPKPESSPLALPPPAEKSIDHEAEKLAAAGRAHFAAQSLEKHLRLLEAA